MVLLVDLVVDRQLLLTFSNLVEVTVAVVVVV